MHNGTCTCFCYPVLFLIVSFSFLKLDIFNGKKTVICQDLYEKFGSKMARKWRELAPFYFPATATAPLFFALAPPQRSPPFSVHASGAVALKVAQVPSTGLISHSRLHFQTHILLITIK